MTRNDKIAVFLLGAAAVASIIRYVKMSDEEKRTLNRFVRDRTNELIRDTDRTMETVNRFLDEYADPSDDTIVNKLFSIRKIIHKLYGAGHQPTIE